MITPQLRHECSGISDPPMLDDLAIRDPVDGDRGHVHLVPGWRDSRQLTLVSPVRPQARDDLSPSAI